MFRMTMAILLMLVSHALGQPVEDASQNRMVPMPNSLDIKMPYLKLFVDKKTLPAGPFLGYDTNGKLVATVYMIPLGDLRSQRQFADLAAPGATVDHVDMWDNPGHIWVPTPHYHIVLWHVSRAEQAALVASAPTEQQGEKQPLVGSSG